MKKYKYIQIGIASPEEIITWANLSLQGKEFKYNPERSDKITYLDENGKPVEYTLKGEVKKHETINYRTLKPERDGLFCEVIFGPTKDYQCACGKSRKSMGDNKTCDKCHVEITESKVRREKMGYIALAAPVVHTWYLRNTPSKIAVLLDMKTRDVEDIVYLASYIITETEENIEEIQVGRILTEQEHSIYKRRYPFKYRAKTGAEAVKYLLHNLNLEELVQQIREELKGATKQKRDKLIKRLDIAESFAKSGNKPEWMVMDVIPVIPPDLRPMVQLDGGRFATTDLNDLYRRIINRNNRLKKQFEQRAPDLIVKNEKRMLQEAVDALIDNSKRNKKAVLDKNRPLKSLSDLLRGKQGRFRQNLLGKRVDYSGRSVIVVGPDLKMYQCGIPREMALILFKPFIINYLRKKELFNNPEAKDKAGIRKAKELIDRGAPQAMEALEKIVVEHPVLLNRAPTLHRLSIQAFEPKLVEGKAIRLHPLVTTAFNADFDGDQMPVHVPLSEEAQAEARLLMLASKNILAPKDGKPVVTPSQDMILGNYYLTIERSQPEKEGRIFKDPAEVEMAYENDEIDLHTRFLIPSQTLERPFVNLNQDASDYQKRLELNNRLSRSYIMTTYGKIIFNRVFPSTFPYVNEPTLENLTIGTSERFFLKTTQINVHEWVSKQTLTVPFNKRFLSLIISEIFKQSKLAETSKALDEMKDLGFKYSTIAGITISAFDIEVLDAKEEIYQKAYKTVQEYDTSFRRGLINAKERKRNVVNVWTSAKTEIEKNIKILMKEKATTNDIFMMADSGARGSSSNFTQLAGMRGLMAKPSGEPMEIPIKSSFREGMTMSEFFISTHGARKGSTDTALKTAESGYLTRRLVDVSQDITVTCEDCGTDKGIKVSDLLEPDYSTNEQLKEKIIGLFTSKPIYKVGTKEILVNRNVEITKEIAQIIIDNGTDKDDLRKIVERNNLPIERLKDRIIGRFTSKPIYIKDGKEILVNRNEFITESIAQKIIDNDITEVEIRSLLTCDALNGVCVKCYGSDLSTNEIVEKGEVVGIVAAQSIGEPGTQLTMRTFHSGGVAGEDITQGLPRIQELFEAREPKAKEIISEIRGTVEAIEPKPDNRFEIRIKGAVSGNDKVYLTDSGKKPNVEINERIKPGAMITGDKEIIHPRELLRVSSVDQVETYLLKEVQRVYRSQGVEISDKHIEIIIKQMLQKALVINEGETSLLPGTFISKQEAYLILKEIFQNYKEAFQKNKRLPIIKPILLGITRASLKADSFLSAASFQETTRVLTEAAIRGKIDTLEGLKENIIIGGLIPAGTGLVNKEEFAIKPVDESVSFSIDKKI